MKLSIIIPAYNEAITIEKLIKLVQDVELPKIEKEIIVVDDCSNDGTREILKKRNDVKTIFHKSNLGKGGAVKSGFDASSGDIVVIQDADLEYDPEDYKRLLKPIIDNRADVVFGSRFKGDLPHRVLYVHHSFANQFLTLLSNIFTGLNLSDMETCYKAFNRSVVDSIKYKLEARKFGIEPELTARIASGKWRVYEVGISYHGRTYEEGKKINWKDGLAAIWHIIYFNLFSK